MTEKWIKKALGKPGSLHKQLDIPENTKIPASLLKKIKAAEIGETIKNPTKIGKAQYKVTAKLKKRAVMALTLKKLSKKKEAKE